MAMTAPADLSSASSNLHMPAGDHTAPSASHGHGHGHSQGYGLTRKSHEHLTAFPSSIPPSSRSSRSSRLPFPLVEIHVARFGSYAAYARATAFASIGLLSSVPTRLPVTSMHPAFVHTAATTAPLSATLATSTSTGTESPGASTSSLKIITSSTSLDDTTSGSLQQPTGLLSPSFMPVSCHVSPVRPLNSLSLPFAASSSNSDHDDDGSNTATPGTAQAGAHSFGARSVDVFPPTVTSPTMASTVPPISLVAPLAATAPASGSPAVVYQPQSRQLSVPQSQPSAPLTSSDRPPLRRNLSSPMPTHRHLSLQIDRPASAHSLDPQPNNPPTANPTADRHILSVSSNNHLLCLLASNGHWNSVEVPLGSIPPGAQALALHASERATAFNFADVVAGKLKSARGVKRSAAVGARSNLVVAVTLEIPPAEGENKPRYALHIYGANTVGSTLEKRLFGLVGDVQVMPLEYRPLQIQHVEIQLEGFEPNALLVTDQDGPVHIYAESLSPRTFQEVAVDRVFDNFPTINSNVTRVNIHDSDTTRYLGLGYASGELVVIVDHRDPKSGLFDRVRQTAHTLPLYFTPITAIHFFTAPHLLRPFNSASPNHPALHLAVAAASEPALVLSNISACLPDLPVPQELPHSCAYDTVTCITSEPVLWNGRPQLLLGTYGQRILMYDVGNGGGEEADGFQLVSVKAMAYPVYNMVWTDLDGDGVRELVVVSMYCLHVLQYDFDLVRSKLIEFVRLRQLETKQLNESDESRNDV